MPAPAGAFLQAHFSDGVLRGIGDPEYDHLGVRCSPRYGATVNGLQPDGEMVACSRVRKIVLLGFGGPDWLDLTNVEAADFTALRKVEGNAGGDSDKLDGASFVPTSSTAAPAPTASRAASAPIASTAGRAATPSSASRAATCWSAARVAMG